MKETEGLFRENVVVCNYSSPKQTKQQASRRKESQQSRVVPVFLSNVVLGGPNTHRCKCVCVLAKSLA